MKEAHRGSVWAGAKSIIESSSHTVGFYAQECWAQHWYGHGQESVHNGFGWLGGAAASFRLFSANIG